MEYKKIFIPRSLSEGGQCFRDLKTWQEGHSLVIFVYKITKDFPREETYSLTDQMRRAAVSVTSNIAEGFGRQGYKEKANFYRMAQGSLTELENQIILSKDLGYLKNDSFANLDRQLKTTQKLLGGLISKTRSFINSNLHSPISNLFFIILISILYSLISAPAAHASKISAPANFLTLNNGLVGYWTFDGSDMSKGVALDKSGNGNNGNLMNIATSTFYTKGKIGQGLKFDGVDDYVTIPYGNGINPSVTPLSASMWVKVNNNSRMIFFSSTVGTNQRLYLDTSCNGTNYWCVATQDTFSVSTFPVVLNKWIFVTLVMDGSNAKLSINNAPLQTVRTYTSYTLASNFDIGRLNAPTVWFNLNGSLDDVRVYNRVLSVKEIQQLYNLGR